MTSQLSRRAGLLIGAALLLHGCDGRQGTGSSAPGVASSGIVARPDLRLARTEASASPQGGYSPAQIRHAYGFDALASTGAGEIIAIVDPSGSPTIQSDLETFSTQFGLPLTGSTLTVIYSAGTPASVDPASALETSLDVEWAHAIAPDARILLVVAPSSSVDDLFAAVDAANAYVDPASGQHPHQVSMSWGASEFKGETGLDAHFGAAGTSYFASSGDNGAGANYPAASPLVVAVGGTTLTLNASGDIESETAWSGSGGGTSAYEVEPSWQDGVQSSGNREVPDVSYGADPATGFAVYDSTPYSGSAGWFQIGGTSAGAPQWAALAATVNAQRATSLAGANAPLYQVAGLGLGTYFRDVVSGSNGTHHDPGFTAGVGYDEVTGLGSPRAAALVPALVGLGSSSTPAPSPSPTPTPTPAPTPSPVASAPSPSPSPSPTARPTPAASPTPAPTPTSRSTPASSVPASTTTSPPTSSAQGGGGGGGCAVAPRGGSPAPSLPLLAIVVALGRWRRRSSRRSRVA